MEIDKVKNQSKIRVNITVDKPLLEKAKTKLNLFGGKVSTLFNAYLKEFVESMQKAPAESHHQILAKINELELKVKKLEEKIK